MNIRNILRHFLQSFLIVIEQKYIRFIKIRKYAFQNVSLGVNMYTILIFSMFLVGLMQFINFYITLKQTLFMKNEY